jgi:hypothetical protein
MPEKVCAAKPGPEENYSGRAPWFFAVLGSMHGGMVFDVDTMHAERGFGIV